MNKYVKMLWFAFPDVDTMLIQEFFEERAAIREYDGKYPRDIAEQLAFADTFSHAFSQF